MGEIVNGQIEDGGCEETFLCLSLKKEKCRFIVPPAVSLLLYISSGILWQIFSQTGIFAGFSLHIINLAVRISAAMMAGDIIFLGCRTVYKGAMDGARGGEHYCILDSLGSTMEGNMPKL